MTISFQDHFYSITSFRDDLLSRLRSSDLYKFLPLMGYRLTHKERRTYMSLDREIFKSTAYIDKLIKEGYSVVLISPNLFEVRDVIRGKKVGDNIWNQRVWGADIKKRPGPYGNWPEWSSDSNWDDMISETKNNALVADTRRLSISSTSSSDCSCSSSGSSTFRKRLYYIDKEAVPRSPEPWYRIKVMVCITHPDASEHNSHGQTVSRNPDMPVALPGKWGPARYYLDSQYLDYKERYDPSRKPIPRGDNLAAQTRRVKRTAQYRIDAISGAQVLCPDDEFVAGVKECGMGFWNLRTDNTEKCAEVVFYEEPSRWEDSFRLCEGTEQNQGEPYILHCKDDETFKFLDSTQQDDLAERTDVQYVQLHRQPLKLHWAYDMPRHPTAPIYPKCIRDKSGRPQHHLMIIHTLDIGYDSPVIYIPL